MSVSVFLLLLKAVLSLLLDGCMMKLCNLAVLIVKDLEDARIQPRTSQS